MRKSGERGRGQRGEGREGARSHRRFAWARPGGRSKLQTPRSKLQRNSIPQSGTNTKLRAMVAGREGKSEVQGLRRPGAGISTKMKLNKPNCSGKIPRRAGGREQREERRAERGRRPEGRGQRAEGTVRPGQTRSDLRNKSTRKDHNRLWSKRAKATRRFQPKGIE